MKILCFFILEAENNNETFFSSITNKVESRLSSGLEFSVSLIHGISFRGPAGGDCCTCWLTLIPQGHPVADIFRERSAPRYEPLIPFALGSVM